MSLRHHHALGRGMTSERRREALVNQLRNEGIKNERVLEAISRVPRHAFVDEAMASRAYVNTALPIGHGQTISQPFVVARMTELLLEDRSFGNVLEIGTGSGYQTAVLAELGMTVYTVERIQPLYEQTRSRLRAMGYSRVRCRLSDGSWGIPNYAPFDAILVTAGAQSLPQALVEQLGDGGRMVAPVGADGKQRLLVIDREGEHCVERSLDPVVFVPLLSGTQQSEL
ncbi:MAG: protein-L-isoaspartate(D-aspartate) O-methyltransferase [Nevskiales bacterium]